MTNSRKIAPVMFVVAIAIVAAILALRAPAQAASAPGRKLALLVGVNEYRHAKLDKLDFAERDVEELAGVLRAQGYRVVLLKGAAARVAGIEDKLKELLKEATAKDLILVALAGHGLQPSGSATAYFCPYDANPTIEEEQGANPNLAKFPDTLLAINGKDGLIARLDESGIGQKLLFVDACRNDTSSGRGRGVASTIVQLPEQTWVMLSCSRKERAFESKKFGGGHGVFFYHVLEGFRGKAADERGVVKWGRLAEYVSESVSEVVPKLIGGGAEQHPHTLESGNAVMALARLTVPRKLPASRFAGTRAGEVRDDNGLKLKFVYCPPGNFKMGSPEDEKGRQRNEAPVDVVLTKGFWLGQTEVTQSQWHRVMKTKPWNGQEYVKDGPDYPATDVSFEDAITFCEKFTQIERHAGRLPEDWKYALPTEAQWEYACRAKTTSAFSFGTRESEFGEYGWYGGLFGNGNARSEHYAHEVRLKKPNPWGLYDMHGNVGEWCRDWYEEKPSGGSDPEGPFSGSERVIRGGCWIYDTQQCRSASRGHSPPNSSNNLFGFRLACTLIGA